MRKLTICAAALLLAGCAREIPAVHLVNSKTGETTRCGPYTANDGVYQANAIMMQGQCIADYQRQGFERAP